MQKGKAVLLVSYLTLLLFASPSTGFTPKRTSFCNLSPFSSSFYESRSGKPFSSRATSVLKDVSDVTSKTFEAQLSTDMLMSMGLVGGVLVFAGSFWWNVIIPQKRSELSISKRNGEVKEYLDGLRDETGENREFEKWLMADWLNAKVGKTKPGALPFLKRAKWNSGGNAACFYYYSVLSLMC